MIYSQVLNCTNRSILKKKYKMSGMRDKKNGGKEKWQIEKKKKIKKMK